MTLGWITKALSPVSPYRMSSPPTEADDAPRGPELIAEDGRALPLVGTSLRIDASSGLARVVLEQTFENASDDTLRVTYKMPLPADGAVSGYAFRIGERTITGRVDPKAKARERFEQALAQGKTAALLEQEKTDIFTQEIGNVPARKTIVATITIDQRLAWLVEGEWELRFPTVIGPRYVGANDTAADARAVAVETSAEPLAARVRLELRIGDAITPGRRAESPSHELVGSGGAAGVYELRSASRLDRDIVVRWAVTKPSVGVALAASRSAEGTATAANAYGLLTIVPPAPEARFASVPRDLIVLLDTSGSMGGTPLAQAKKIVKSLLGSLRADDRFEVIEFSTSPNAFHAGPLPATERDKRAAIAWVENRSAGGGTEMHTAVVEALRALRPGAQRQVVLVTDGYIGGEEQIIALLHDKLPESCRLHVVGVGAAPNRALATSLARAGRGAEVLAALDEDTERATKRLLDKTVAPVLTDVVLSGSALIAQAPEHVPDVFAGSPVLAGLELRPEGGELVVRGKLARGEWEQRVRVPAIGAGEGNAAIVALYARERVADLDIRWSIGRNAEGVDRAVERIGVDFQIATRLTSWVAVDDQRSVDPYAPTRHESVPQELPYGTSLASFGPTPGAALFAAATTRAGTLGTGPRPLAGIGFARMAPPGAPPPPAQYEPPKPQELGAALSKSAAPAPQSTPMTAPPKKRRLGLFVALLFGFLLALAIAAIVWFFGR